MKRNNVITGTPKILLIAAAMTTVGVVFYTQLVVPAQEVESCSLNLHQIGIAIHAYESCFRSLPVAIELDSRGRPYRSWRTQLYPTYIAAISTGYDATSSWNSPSNMRLLNGSPISLSTKSGEAFMTTLSRFPSIFVCPSCPSSQLHGIHYVVVSGQGTAFPESSYVSLSEITDGLENTILVVESVTCNPDWTEPRDLDFDSMSFSINDQGQPSISSYHPIGPLVCFADSGVFHITAKATEAEVKALLTIAGNEHVHREDLVKRGVLVLPR